MNLFENVCLIILFGLITIILCQLYLSRTERLGKLKFNSFNDSWQARPFRVYEPEGISEIQEIMVNNPGQNIRAIGSQYSFNSSHLTNDVLVLMRKMDRIISILGPRVRGPDVQEGIEPTVTVETGKSLFDLCSELHKRNLALQSVPENTRQTIGGVLSNGLAGSDLSTGSLSDSVKSILVVLRNGHIRKVEFDDPEFPAFSASLGIMGIICQVTLKCVPMYFAKIIEQPCEDLNVEKILQKNPRTMILLDGKKTVSAQWLTSPTESLEFKPYYALGNIIHKNKSTIAVPIEDTKNAIKDVQNLCKIFALKVFITVSFSGADYNCWLSPGSGRDTAWITVVFDGQNKLFVENLEDLLLYKYKGRPDWSTAQYMNAGKARLVYGIAYDYVKRLSEKFDPNREMINEHYKEIFL